MTIKTSSKRCVRYFICELVEKYISLLWKRDNRNLVFGKLLMKCDDFYTNYGQVDISNIVFHVLQTDFNIGKYRYGNMRPFRLAE